jgi:glucose-6-phosphate dehydrogenase assembly protein OpcA
VSFDLTDTNSSEIAAGLLQQRLRAGSPTMGMVLTLIVVTDESGHYAALKAAAATAMEHPARILGVIRGSAKAETRLDAEIRIGQGSSGETVLLRMSGELIKHAESVLLPLLLPDSPVVAWWPAQAPDDPAGSPIGALAERRITDSAAAPRSKSTALRVQAEHYADGNTDLAWTRLTPWRALLAAALDQHPVKVRSARVTAERVSPSADLLAAWLKDRLGVPVERANSRGPGITSVHLEARDGTIGLDRPDGRVADFRVPGQPDRPVALKRREIAELLAEELRRLDADDVYAATLKTLLSMDGVQTEAKPKRS